MMLTSRTIFQTKNNKVILNLTADLPYKLFCKKQFNNKNQRLTRKIPNQVWNDFCDITARGFTLIELLVVVLIIGILAAVALPQYQLAVVKSRVSAYFPLMKNIVEAETAYYLANGEPSLDVSKLDLDMPADCTLISDQRFFACGKDVLLDNSSLELILSYCPGYNTTVSSCYEHRDFAIAFYNNGYNNNRKECIVKQNSALGTKICKLLTF